MAVELMERSWLQVEAPAVKVSDIQLWNSDKRLQTQVCTLPNTVSCRLVPVE